MNSEKFICSGGQKGGGLGEGIFARPRFFRIRQRRIRH